MPESSLRRSRSRSRSRSPPPRAPRGPRRGGGGFRWKDDRQNTTRDSYRGSERRGDYRDRSRSPRRNQGYARERGGRESSPKRLNLDSRRKDDETKKSKKPAKPGIPSGRGLEMIVIHVNDRLGTKTAIPCLPTDTIGQLKLMIAARIGRESGQIMLRRQGERPFKDQLTLDDYGVSNGVQLDLEVDTGD